MSEPFLPIPPTSDRSTDGEAATLLYIEDTLSNLQLVKLVIDALRPRWRLLAAQDGHDGLRLAREQCPDLILLNLQLFGMSGEAVLAELRRLSASAWIPVVILSADASTQTRARLLALGANDFLAKPFDVNLLVAKLDALWQSSRGKVGGG